MTDYCIAFVCF